MVKETSWKEPVLSETGVTLNWEQCSRSEGPGVPVMISEGGDGTRNTVDNLLEESGGSSTMRRSGGCQVDNPCVAPVIGRLFRRLSTAHRPGPQEAVESGVDG